MQNHRRVLISLVILHVFAGYFIGMAQNSDSLLREVDAAIVKEDYPLVAKLYDQVALAYRGAQNFDSAYIFHSRALDIRQQYDLDDQALSYLYLGAIAHFRIERQLAIQNFKEALRIAESIPDTVRITQALNNIGLQYTELKVFDSAIFYLGRSIAIKEQLADELSLANSYSNVGLLYSQMDEYDSALVFHQRALKFRIQNNAEQYRIAESYSNLANVLYFTKEFDSMMVYLSKAKEIAFRDTIPELLEDIYGLYTELKLDEKEIDSARYYLQRLDSLRYFNLKAENRARLNELRVQYDVEKKDLEIAQQDAEIEAESAKTRLFQILGVGLFLVFVAAVIFYNYRSKVMRSLMKKDKELFDQEVDELLQKQEVMTLSARLDGQDQERKRIAADLHDRLGSNLSAVKLYFQSDSLNGDNKQIATELLDQTIQETREIAHNLASGVLNKFGLIAAIENLKETLEQSRQIEIDLHVHKVEIEKIPEDIQTNIYRVIQELISNVLKHAEADHITIQLAQHNDTLNITVEDNGVGFDTNNIKTKGIGLRNMNVRVEQFGGEMVFDSSPGNGTTVMINLTIPTS